MAEIELLILAGQSSRSHINHGVPTLEFNFVLVRPYCFIGLLL